MTTRTTLAGIGSSFPQNILVEPIYQIKEQHKASWWKQACAAELTVVFVSAVLPFGVLVTQTGNSVIPQTLVYIPEKLVSPNVAFVWTAAQSTKSSIYIKDKEITL